MAFQRMTFTRIMLIVRNIEECSLGVVLIKVEPELLCMNLNCGNISRKLKTYEELVDQET